MPNADLARRLAELAAPQRGLLHPSQARAVGASDDVLRYAVATQGWRLLPGRVLALPGSNPDDELTRIFAACLAPWPRVARASHTAAAVLLGLDRVTPAAHLEISAEGVSRLELPGVIVHRTRCLPAEDVTRVHGVPCTSAARTLVDLAARLSTPMLASVLDDAIAARRTSRELVHRRARSLRNGRRGVQRLVQLTEPGAEGVFWSWLERHAAPTFAAAGLVPRWNVPLNGDRNRIGTVDCLFEDRLAVELHSLRFHSAPDQVQRDAAKQRRAVAEGYSYLAFTWLDVVTRPDDVVREVRAALERH